MIKYLYSHDLDMVMRILYISILLIFSKNVDVFAQLDSTNIPLIVIDAKGAYIVDEPKISADLKIINQADGYNKPEDVGNIYDGKVGIEIRGRYSASLPQKPYGFETRDEFGENLNIPLFHMPPENDWILLANYNDKTFMRNTLSFELFRKMGHYAPRTQFCEVLTNGVYQGIYVLTEKIKADKGRVDISKLNPDENSGDDVSGGYIIKVDYYNDNDSWKSSFPPMKYPDKEVHFVYHYPKPEDISGEQKIYIKDFIFQLETALYSPNTPTRHNELYSLLDIDSFIDYFILGELSRNVDAYKKSAYFHKDKDSEGGKLHAGPVWDFDWAWKNINECYFGATNGSGWAYQVHKCNPWPSPPTWMGRLLEDQYFTQKLNERYFSLRTSHLSEVSIFSYIDSVAVVLDDAQKRHYQKWQILGLNVGTPETDPQPRTYAGEIEKFKSWISKRLNWLDANMPEFVITGLEENDFISKSNLMYPNPVTSQMNIQSVDIIKNYSIHTSNGKAVIKGSSNSSQITLDTHFLPSGLYIIKTQHQDGSQWAGKFMKSE